MAQKLFKDIPQSVDTGLGKRATRGLLSLTLAALLLEGCAPGAPRPIPTPIARDRNPCYTVGKDAPSCADPFLGQYMDEVGALTSQTLRAELVGRGVSVPNEGEMVSIILDEDVVKRRSAPSLNGLELPRQKGSVLVVENPLLVRGGSTNPSQRRSDYWLYAHTHNHPDQNGVGRVFFSAVSPETIDSIRVIRSGVELSLGGDVNPDGYIGQFGIYGNDWEVQNVTNEQGHMLTRLIRQGFPRMEEFPATALRVSKDNPLSVKSRFVRMAEVSGQGEAAAQEHRMAVVRAIMSLSQ